MQEVQAIDWNAKLVNWFIRNTQLAALLFIALIVGGVATFFSLRSEGFPSPDINVMLVNAVYPGASSTEIEQQIIKPLEAATQGVNGISDINSTAADSIGFMSVNFTSGTDVKAAMSELRTKIQNVVLPTDAQKPEITVPQISGNESYYALVAEGEATIRADGDELKRQLESVKGVKLFSLASELKDRLEIRWNSAALSQNGVTPADVSQALAANNLSIPAGSITLNDRDVTVVTSGILSDIVQLGDVVIKTDTAARPPRQIRVKDVAEIVPTTQQESLVQQIAYKDEVREGLPQFKTAFIYKLQYNSDVDIIQTDKAVVERLEIVEKEKLLKNSSVISLYNVAEQTKDQIREIEESAVGGKLGTGPLSNLGYLLGGIWLVIISMLLFVSWRAALISGLAIPLSILFTFLALKVQGVSLNTLTLFSMILVLGLIVDPAIVVLEAIQHELDQGKRGKNAVIAAMNTIGSGVFMAVVTSIIVFIPFGVVSGIFGQIIRYIPITVIPALVASYFVPLLFLTYLAQRFLKPSKNHGGDTELESLWRSSQWIVRANTSILKRRWAQVLIIVVGFGLSFGIVGYLFAKGHVTPVQFSSPNDSESITVSVEYPSNLSESAKRDVLTRLGQKLASQSYVQSYFPLMETKQGIQLSLRLLPRNMRDADSKDIAAQLSNDLITMEKPEQKIFLTATQDSVGTPQAQFPVAVNIFGDNLDSLKKAAIQTGNILRSQPNVTRVEDGFTGSNNPQIVVRIDREKLAQTGLPVIVVAQALSGILGESTVTKVEYPIEGSVRPADVILVNTDKPTTVDGVRNLVIAAVGTQVITVKDVATIDEIQGFTGINRLNGSRFITVQAQVNDPIKDAAAPQKAVKDFWTKEKLKEFGLRSDALESKGTGDEFVKSFKDLFLALLISIIMSYLAFVLFFKSFSQPFIILFAVPLSFLGAFPAIALVGGQFGFLEILGIITLVSIVENVGIFLIDLANRKREEGMDYKQAIAEASGIRFRPIFLTKVTALGGLLPLMIISPFWRTLALVIVTGIITSGILSLFTTPIMYCWLIEAKSAVSRWKFPRRVRKPA